MYAQRRMSGGGRLRRGDRVVGVDRRLLRDVEAGGGEGLVGAHVSVAQASFAEGGVVGFAERDVHGLLVGVEVDRAVAALVAEAGRLDAAERGAEVAHVVRVEPHHAGLDRLREVVRALEVVRPDVGGEAVLRVVRERERLFVGVERGDRDDRAEDLLLEDPRVGRDVGEHGRRDEVAGRRSPRGGRRRRPGGPRSCRSRRSSSPCRSARGARARRPRSPGRAGSRRRRAIACAA